jgi:hypothetical protein
MADQRLYSDGSEDQKYPEYCGGDWCNYLAVESLWRAGWRYQGLINRSNLASVSYFITPKFRFSIHEKCPQAFAYTYNHIYYYPAYSRVSFFIQQ